MGDRFTHAIATIAVTIAIAWRFGGLLIAEFYHLGATTGRLYREAQASASATIDAPAPTAHATAPEPLPRRKPARRRTTKTTTKTTTPTKARTRRAATSEPKPNVITLVPAA